MSDSPASTRGIEPSIVERFEIQDLYGYRTISLASEYAATILIAKNGSGKTTLLAALDACLKRQFSRLRDLKFYSLRCKLRGHDEIEISHDDVLSYGSNDAIELEARRAEIPASQLLTFIEDFTNARLEPDDEVGNKIYSRFGYRRADAIAHCDKLRSTLYEKVPALGKASKVIEAALQDTEVVYLPTYRRIELSIIPQQDRHGRPRRASFPGTRPTLYSGDIQFGLSDILDRLAQMNQQVVYDSNLGYRELSASIINELINGQFDDVSRRPEVAIPDRDELELFFSRLKVQRTLGPYMEVSIPNMEKIYTGQDISDERNRFLRYFLSKLNTVIQSTRDVETQVRDFIASCNKYLSFQDLSTTLGEDPELEAQADIDGKSLQLDRRDLRVSVKSLSTNREIPLDALSSGEKQMISLFAKLFLYPKNKILLIDEPELSLSIDWQRTILVDVMKAPRCKQAIAITHSPFIFDNELEPFARTLRSTINMVTSSATNDEVEAESNE